MSLFFFFFFSSRRRHTRCSRDWSSDVCSSDLGVPPGPRRALGWDTPADSGYTSAGAKLSRRAFGHTGFTGTSLWMDPDRDLFIILLTNRVNPTRANTAILHVRPRVADLVLDALTRP